MTTVICQHHMSRAYRCQTERFLRLVIRKESCMNTCWNDEWLLSIKWCDVTDHVTLVEHRPYNSQPRSQSSPCSLLSRWRTLQGYPWSMLMYHVIKYSKIFGVFVTWSLSHVAWWLRHKPALTRGIPGASAILKIANRETTGIEVGCTEEPDNAGFLEHCHLIIIVSNGVLIT